MLEIYSRKEPQLLKIKKLLLQAYLSILGRLVIHTNKGMRKAAVLPDPVSATPMTSRFCRPIGI